MVDETVKNFFARIDECKTIEDVAAIDDPINNVNFTRIFWESRKTILTGKDPLERRKAVAKCRYINNMFASSIPVSANVNQFRAPHGFKGIAISGWAKIGTGCTIFQNVTIGSNTLPDSKNAGFPTVGNNCYIGAGAMIIGNVTIGNNVRIGAGCSVTIDIPDNATVVQSKPTLIRKDTPPDNRFIPAGDFRKLFTPPPPFVGTISKRPEDQCGDRQEIRRGVPDFILWRSDFARGSSQKCFQRLCLRLCAAVRVYAPLHSSRRLFDRRVRGTARRHSSSVLAKQFQ